MDDEKVLERFDAYLADVRREGGTASQFLNVTLSALSCMCLSKNAVEVYRDNANTLADKRLSKLRMTN